MAVDEIRGGHTGAFLPATGVNTLRGGRTGRLLPAAGVNIMRGGHTGALLPATGGVDVRVGKWRKMAGGSAVPGGAAKPVDSKADERQSLPRDKACERHGGKPVSGTAGRVAEPGGEECCGRGGMRRKHFFRLIFFLFNINSYLAG